MPILTFATSVDGMAVSGSDLRPLIHPDSRTVYNTDAKVPPPAPEGAPQPMRDNTDRILFDCIINQRRGA
jgi:hypothetical protein